jgi:hypothetical protein
MSRVWGVNVSSRSTRVGADIWSSVQASARQLFLAPSLGTSDGDNLYSDGVSGYCNTQGALKPRAHKAPPRPILTYIYCVDL